MPSYAVARLEDRLGSLVDKRVAVLGACYRGGVKETAFSGVFPLVRLLSERRATVSVHDPLFTDDELRGLGFRPYHLGEECDAVIIQANHVEYRHLASTDLPGATTILDGRRCLESSDALTSNGVSVLRIGG
jgi:UDP-N-acetyl-D-mannosaminuronate dehydrogenase